MNKTYVTLLVLVLVVGGAFVLWRGKTLEAPAVEDEADMGGASGTVEEGSPQPVPQKQPFSTGLSTGVKVGAVKEFTITSTNFAFNPKDITVQKGDRVRINFKNTDGYHNLVIDEFNVATKTLNEGGSDTVEFVANKIGSFVYYCSVGNHRTMGMWGRLNVE